MLFFRVQLLGTSTDLAMSKGGLNNLFQGPVDGNLATRKSGLNVIFQGPVAGNFYRLGYEEGWSEYYLCLAKQCTGTI